MPSAATAFATSEPPTYFNVTTGFYKTLATNNEYGTLTEQVTNGASYNKVGTAWVVTGTYKTVAARTLRSWMIDTNTDGVPDTRYYDTNKNGAYDAGRYSRSP